MTMRAHHGRNTIRIVLILAMLIGLVMLLILSE